MSRVQPITILALILISTPSTSSPLQTTPPTQSTDPGKAVTFFWAEQAGAEETVAGSPFIATAAIKTEQTLINGNRFVNRSTQKLARDGQGRLRREQAIGKIGGLQVEGPTLVFIYDPVAQVSYTLDPASHTARVGKLETMTLSSAENLRQGGSVQRGPREHASPTGRRSVVSEPLGSRVIEGFEVEGTRRTVTFPAGALGNEQAFSVSVETWFSPLLHTDVLRKRNDPRVGETEYRLTDIRREEPDPSLFQVPVGYKTIPAQPLPRGRE